MGPRAVFLCAVVLSCLLLPIALAEDVDIQEEMVDESVTPSSCGGDYDSYASTEAVPEEEIEVDIQSN